MLLINNTLLIPSWKYYNPIDGIDLNKIVLLQRLEIQVCYTPVEVLV